jgi:hypothetical protein
MIFGKTNLSLHAKKRLSERFRISSERLLEILNMGHGIKIGASVESHLAHRLLWSPVDEQIFVAIQNVINGTILTVLTLEMYRRDYGSSVTERRVQKVINMMVHSGMAPASLWKPDVPKEYVTVYADLCSTNNIIALGRWKGAVDSVYLEDLGTKIEFWSWVATQITARGAMLDEVLSVKAKFTGGDFQNVPYAC